MLNKCVFFCLIYVGHFDLKTSLLQLQHAQLQKWSSAFSTDLFWSKCLFWKKSLYDYMTESWLSNCDAYSTGDLCPYLCRMQNTFSYYSSLQVLLKSSRPNDYCLSVMMYKFCSINTGKLFYIWVRCATIAAIPLQNSLCRFRGIWLQSKNGTRRSHVGSDTYSCLTK